MKKNVASQVVGVEMVTIASGAPFTGTVTAYYTGDNGTQTIGSVASGVCVHKGRGTHTYAPSQAETNFDHIAFTFEGSGAITAMVQLYTDFPQTGDAFARVGAPAGVSVSADVAAIQADTNDLQARVPSLLVGGRMDSSVGAMAADVVTAAAIAANAIGASELAADAVTEIQSGLATQASVDTIDDFLDTEIAAIKAKTDSLTYGVAGVVDANVLRIDGSSVAAVNLKQSATVIYVGSVTGAATTTTLVDSALTQTGTDHWKGRIIIFVTGTLKYQATDITGFTPATDTLTFTALTAAPSAADVYVVL